MNRWRIVLAGVRFYWRTHLGVALGAALGALVLSGALLVGDSVKATLRAQALARVGGAGEAMVAGERFFRDALAADVGHGTAPVLLLRGSVARGDGEARVNQAQVLGVDERFWALSPAGAPGPEAAAQVALNERLAAELRLQPGDDVVLRVEKPGVFSRDAPLSGEENEIVALRLTVGRVVRDAEYGRFGLQASQVPPFSVFLPLGQLQERLAFAGRANLLLAPAGAPPLAGAVEARWQLADAGLELRALAAGGLELRTPRVFLDPVVAEAAPRGLDSLTYLVNELRAGERAVPYSMVTALDAAGSGFLPAELADDEIVINQWLADQLQVGPRDPVELKYFVMGERRQLEERTARFEVLAVLPMGERQLDRSWMPDFPGLTDAGNCRDWKPGFALDTKRIRDEDEAYWDEYRGTPKAFINIAMGQKLWSNRWGALTSVRYPAGSEQAAVAAKIRSALSPGQAGLQFVALREAALAATRAPVDFGELFASFSFFLMVAAAVLTGLLFVFSLEQRNAEAGLLLAVGLGPRMVRRMALMEGALVALAGSALGGVLGLLYTKAVLRALGSVWRGAVGAVDFVFAPRPATLLTGVAAGVLIALLAMFLASRRQLAKSARALLAGEPVPAKPGRKRRRLRRESWMALGCGALAAALAALGGGSPGAFFGAGALLLTAGVFLTRSRLRRMDAGGGLANWRGLGVRNAARRPGRSLATASVLASGVFMVVAVDSFRQRPPGETSPRDSGTGGFALVGESALPIYEDLNTGKGREQLGLDAGVLSGVEVVPMRVREGDDASCLNLNRALEPRLLAVQPAELARRGAFHFAAPRGEGWMRLEREEADGCVPGVVDAATLQWALQMKLGDVLTYRDERGEPLRVRLAATVSGSILQGSVLIAERHFTSRFPSRGGYRFFLIDAPAGRAAAVRAELSRALSDRGFEAAGAAARLAAYQAVENTYLSIFQVLGGLGLLLGSAGLGIVVARNVLERRREFALLEALGFEPRQLRALVFAEHRWLILWGLANGALSALVAVWPSLAGRAGGFPFLEMALLLAALLAGCVFWAWLATRVALRGSGLAALRSE